jgi:hypothetical protein
MTQRHHATVVRALAFALLATRVATAAGPVRVATFNLALYDAGPGEVLARLESGGDPQAQHLAEIIQRVRPDILVLNEIDFDSDGRVLAAFADKYLAAGQNVSQSPAGPAKPFAYPHRMAFAANTGEHSGRDLDRNGRIDPRPTARDYAGDCWGYGVYPGQYAFALLSRYPIDAAAVRQFRRFLWKDMPGALLPDDPATQAPADWYSAEILAGFRLSSKNHCDVPVTIDGKRIHLLLSHPTPPVFDGAEDRNGRRNHDELRFWRDYTASRFPVPSPSAGRAREGGAPGTNNDPTEVTRNDASYLRDDAGGLGGLPSGESFIILGDLNGDPHDGQGSEGITQLITAPQILKYAAPTSRGAVEAARLQGGANATHQGDHAEDTEDAADSPGPGNLRLDYVLPSADLKVVASGVFWPEKSDPLAVLVAGAAEPASSDHRLTWIDVAW